MNKIIRSLLKSMIGRIGAQHVFLKGRVIVLAYHRVLPPARARAEHPALVVTDEEFERQLNWLCRRFELVSLNALYEGSLDLSPNADPRIVITFDDGWWDTAQIAGPILKRHGISATIFLTTNLVGTRNCFWWQYFEHLANALGLGPALMQLSIAAQGQGWEDMANTLKSISSEGGLENAIEGLKRLDGKRMRAALMAACANAGLAERSLEPQLMTWKQVISLAEDGHTFGPHTRFHDILTVLPGDVACEEITQSFQELKDRNIPVTDVFAFPNGDNNALVRSLVSSAGFRYAVGMKKGSFRMPAAQPFDLPRINVGLHNAPNLDRFAYLLATAGLRVQ